VRNASHPSSGGIKFLRIVYEHGVTTQKSAVEIFTAVKHNVAARIVRVKLSLYAIHAIRRGGDI
jgi:hypothetical protein